MKTVISRDEGLVFYLVGMDDVEKSQTNEGN